MSPAVDSAKSLFGFNPSRPSSSPEKANQQAGMKG